jgi:23S rRNA (uridine2552-2'-O)-methyltransferase
MSKGDGHSGNSGGISKKGPSGRSYKTKAGLTKKPKKMRGRKLSSQRWLTRQLNDPFVSQTHERGLRSRAAIKLEQMDDKHHFLRPHMNIVDLGCAPGGWLQIISKRCRLDAGIGCLVGIDLLETEAVAGSYILQGDIHDPLMLEEIKSLLEGKADIVLSDMAAATTGHRPTDHLRTMGLLEIAIDFADEVLADRGVFLAKTFRGGADKSLLRLLNERFEKVKNLKPAASRVESVETYLLATGYLRAEKAEQARD